MKAYRLIKKEEIKELNGTLAEYEHIKTGARLVHINNGDPQKLFMIAFRTMPEDGTGIAHIMEHSVLEGSMKFPVKSPFQELMRGSLNTFINAMTGDDFTCYPFISPNTKDFFNLLDVYLNAVFCPRMYVDPKILMQEGWHYEFNDKDELVINGVVYNEMKGATSSAQSKLFEAIAASLFTNLYQHNSGGDPKQIPNLTQAQFEAFHKKFYNPTNSCTVLMGDMDPEPVMDFIDQNYFSTFEKGEVLSIPAQERFTAPREVVAEYPIENDEPEEGMTYLGISRLTTRAGDRELNMGLELLANMLFESDAAPVKNAVLAAGIGKEVNGFLESSKDCAFHIMVSGAEADDMPRLRETLDSTLRGIVKDGIDRKLIEATINRYEFNLRESQFAGLRARVGRAISVARTWDLGQDIAESIRYEKLIASIREKAAHGFFEGLIASYLLDNPHTVFVTLKPAKGLLTAQQEAERARLAAVKAGMSEAELADIRAKADELRRHQQEPDSPEALATVPHVTLEDAEKKAGCIALEERECNGVKLLFHEENTAGIAYCDAIFDLAALDQTEYAEASILAKLLGRLPAGGRSYEELANEINSVTGGIAAGCENLTRPGGSVYSTMHVNFKCVNDKLEATVALVKDILTATDYACEERLVQLIQSMFAEQQSSLMDNGQTLAITRNQSYILPEGAAEDSINGLGAYSTLTHIASTMPDGAKELGKKLASIAARLFGKNNLVLTLTGSEDEYKAFGNTVPALVSSLGSAPFAPIPFRFTPGSRNEGILSSAMVQYVVMAADAKKLGYKYNGSLIAVKSYLNSGYLWNNIRVQGGAYGCGVYSVRNGLLGFTSYRDPKLTETLDVYRGVGEHLRTAPLTQYDVDMLIISCIAHLDSPMPPAQAGAAAVERYFMGVSQADIQRERDELLATTVKDFRDSAEMFDAVTSQECYCVFGNADKLRANKEIFAALIKPEE